MTVSIEPGEDASAPAISIVRGNPTAAEIAAVTAVVSASLEELASWKHYLLQSVDAKGKPALVCSRCVVGIS